jgi:hypothetical protein
MLPTPQQALDLMPKVAAHGARHVVAALKTKATRGAALTGPN